MVTGSRLLVIQADLAPFEKPWSKLRFEWVAKNAQMTRVASRDVLGSSSNADIRSPPGHACPPPEILYSSTVAPSAHGAHVLRVSTPVTVTRGARPDSGRVRASVDRVPDGTHVV